MIADWYFDFVSPFAYLQSEQLHSLAPRIAIRYRPVLFAGLLGANGQKGPAEIPAKRAFTYRFCIWQARRQGIALKFPPEHPFNPLPLLRLAIACDCAPEAIHRIFRFVWADGRLPDLPIEWAELASALGVPDAETRIATPEVKAELQAIEASMETYATMHSMTPPSHLKDQIWQRLNQPDATATTPAPGT